VATQSQSGAYPARLEIDYPEKLDRFSTFFRLIWIIPIAIIANLLSSTGSSTVTTVVNLDTGEVVRRTTESGGGIVAGLFAATALMIVFRERYPRWWFDFSREFARFGMRIGAYLVLLTDQYPSTEDAQAVHLDIDYPDVKQDLNRFLPLVKWLLAIPHYIVLVVLAIGAIFSIFIAWFAILFTGRYPRGLFDYVVGVARWGLRVQAYSILLVTDDYPPFSLE
jgi:small-conductance mechanosensitive channel